MAEQELCIDCDNPLEEEEYPRCTECQLIEDGELGICPKCEDVVQASELTSHSDDDRCDNCRRQPKELADDISDYNKRIRP